MWKITKRKMKIFQEVRKMCNFIELNVSKEFPRFYWFNIKMLSIGLVSVLFPISTTIFFLFGAQTFTEYAMSAYISSTMINSCVASTFFVRNAEKIFKMFENFEQAIEKRKYYIIWNYHHSHLLDVTQWSQFSPLKLNFH